MYKTLKTRCFPTIKQEKLIKKFFKERAIIYNLAIDLFCELTEEGIKKSYKEISKKKFSIMKLFRNPENEILYKHCKNVPSVVFELAISDLTRAIKTHSWKKNSHIKHISVKNSSTCSWHRKNLKSFGAISKKDENLKWLFLDNLYYLSLAEKLPCERKDIVKVTIKKEYGEYYACIVYNYEIKKPILQKTKKRLGIDWGIKDYLTCFDGKEIKKINFDKRVIRKKIRKVKSKQKNFRRKLLPLSKKTAGSKQRFYYSKNSLKAKISLQKAWKNFTNYRYDFIKKFISKVLVKSFQSITLENLDIVEMKSKGSVYLNRGIENKPFYLFKVFLVHKFNEFGKKVYEVPANYKSSQICSSCGYTLSKKEKLKNSERVFICPECDFKEDRDVNAAINIYRERKLLKEIILD